MKFILRCGNFGDFVLYCKDCSVVSKNCSLLRPVDFCLMIKCCYLSGNTELKMGFMLLDETICCILSYNLPVSGYRLLCNIIGLQYYILSFDSELIFDSYILMQKIR